MTTFTTDLHRPASRRFAIWFEAYMRRLSRADRVDTLNARSDDELAAMGLTRADIPRHVFRGMTHF